MRFTIILLVLIFGLIHPILGQTKGIVVSPTEREMFLLESGIGFYKLHSTGKLGFAYSPKDPIEYIYDVLNFHRNLGIVAKKDGKWGVLSRTHQTIIPFEYDYLCSTPYRSEEGNGHFIVRKNNKFGTINSENQIILPIEYDSISGGWCEYGPTKYHFVCKNGKYGTVSEYGIELLPCIFDMALNYQKIIVVRKGTQYGLFDSRGKEILKVGFETYYSTGYREHFLFKSNTSYYVYNRVKNELDGILTLEEVKNKYPNLDLNPRKSFSGSPCILRPQPDGIWRNF